MRQLLVRDSSERVFLYSVGKQGRYKNVEGGRRWGAEEVRVGMVEYYVGRSLVVSIR